MLYRSTVSSIVLAVLLILGGCTAMTGRSAGQNVDDSTITASVKAKLASERVSTLTRIDVDTTNQIVALNGVVESPEQKAQAERLAKQVSGVKSVQNNLQIQKKQ